MSINVRVLYTEGCANTPPTVQLIERVAQDVGISVEISQVLVMNQEQAEAFRTPAPG